MLFIRLIFHVCSLVNFLILRYLQFSHLSSRSYGVVEKYHGILKTCYLQNVQIRDMNNHNQRAIVIAPSETDRNLIACKMRNNRQ